MIKGPTSAPKIRKIWASSLPESRPGDVNYTPLTNAQGVSECHFYGKLHNKCADFSWKSETEVAPVYTERLKTLNLEIL